MAAMGFDPQKERDDVLKRGNLFKRIKLAMKERKKVKIKEKENQEPLFPGFVDEALENMEKIDKDKEIQMKKLKGEAEKLRKASEKQSLNRNEKEVNK